MTENAFFEEENINLACDGAEEKNQSTAEDIRENIPEKTFTQSQLEALISDRLKRERKNAENLRSVKDLLKKLSQSGVLNASSYADMSQELVKRLTEINDGEKEDSRAGGILSETSGEEKQHASENSTDITHISEAVPVSSPNQAAEPCESQDTPYVLTASDARAIKNAYPSCDIGALMCDEAFESFADGRSGGIEKIYGDYLTFMTALNSKNENLERRMYADNASTSFSVSDKAYSSDGSENLTKRQMEIARQNGMSYREYSRLLSDLPRSNKF